MEAIFSFISEYYPTIGLLIIVAIVAYFAAMYHASIQNTKKKVDGLPCDDHKEAMRDIQQTMKEEMRDTRQTMKEIRESLNRLPCDSHRGWLLEISEWVMKKDKSMIETLTAKFSPYQLTDAGKKLLEISGGKQCIDQNLDMFMSELRNLNPLTPYDVEGRASSILLEHKNLPIFNRIKNFLYYMPKTIEGIGDTTEISFFSMANIMGIYLRDIYLNVHPELLSEKEEFVFS